MSARVSRLFVYPVKGCRGIAVSAATLAATGLEIDGVGDREWVVVDAGGEFLSQREWPKMALIECRLTSEALHLAAPGMLQLVVPLASEGNVERVRVWHDDVNAVTQGEVADAWLSRYLGQPCRLMRFDPLARRLSLHRYTGALVAPYKFADAFALLVCSEASLGDLNQRLAAGGNAAVDFNRFRPNIVVDGIEAFDEDYVEGLRIGAADIRVVKTCVRCAVPNVDPDTAQVGSEPGATLAAYRNDAQAGGITFGVNAVVAGGAGALLRVGDAAEISLRF